MDYCTLPFQHHCPVRCNKHRGSNVCATDGKTYNNECEIMELQCAGQDVFFDHFGGCCQNNNCDDYEGEALLQFDMQNSNMMNSNMMQDAVAFDDYEASGDEFFHNYFYYYGLLLTKPEKLISS